MKLIDCTRSHSGEIQAIFNDAIVTSTALYDYEPRSAEQMAEWFAVREKGGYPVIGLINDDDELAGFGFLGPFRHYAGYRYTVEHGLYVRQDFRGRGLGRQLLDELVRRAEKQGYHAMIGVIDAGNQASIALHEKCGFILTGRMNQIGYKFGRWLDVVYYQKIFPAAKD